MWPGPYGEWGSRKYLLATLDQSLERMGLDYVDIFYSHRFDPETPLEETMGALDTAVRQGKALYAGISSYSAEKTREAAAILRDLGTPLLIHQPSYSMLNRWIEPELLDALGELGVGCIVFSPLAQGMLTDKYLDGIPEGSRASWPSRFAEPPDRRGVGEDPGAERDRRGAGQSLAQLALAWVLRDLRVTSALIGASSVQQLEDNVAALDRPRPHRRGARGDRPPRDRQRHQPLVSVERRLGVTPRRGPVGHEAAQAVPVAGDGGIQRFNRRLCVEPFHRSCEWPRRRQPFEHAQRGGACREHAPVRKHKPK